MMGDTSFDLIAEELVKQQHIMEQLQEENRKLHQQLADLREGRGIFLEIAGQRFAPGEINEAVVEKANIVAIASPIPEQPELPGSERQDLSALSDRDGEQRPVASPVKDGRKETAATRKNSASKTTTFLEEIMLDEFTSALTAPIAAVPTTPAPAKKPEMSEEEKKAALRRELMGSYLLE